MFPVLKRRSSKRMYAGLTLLILAIGAISTALLVPPAWRAKNAAYINAGRDPVVGSVDPNFVPVATPVPQRRSPSVCGVWRSETSQKQYSFVCHDKDIFGVNEINGTGTSNSGSGHIKADGRIEANLLVLPKNRVAHLNLTISNDGKTMDGAWYGEAPSEHGELVFHKVE